MRHVLIFDIFPKQILCLPLSLLSVNESCYNVVVLLATKGFGTNLDDNSTSYVSIKLSTTAGMTNLMNAFH